MGVERMARRRNKNRGYQQLRVWRDAVELYGLTCQAVRDWPFERKKIASQSIASVDSVHRNIAEGYCRRSLLEYLQFLNCVLRQDHLAKAFPVSRRTIRPGTFQTPISTPGTRCRFDRRTH